MTAKRVGVIGFPVEHSLSPIMHNAAFEALRMSDWRYDAMSIPPDILRLGLREPKNHGYIGINVTVPHKEAIMQYVRPDEKARAIGAVNTVDFRNNVGTNTDADGFINDLRANQVAGSRRAGAGFGRRRGGARRGLRAAARRARRVIVNRTKSRADKLVAQLCASAGLRGATVMTLDQAADWGMTLIVNCTSVGLHPHIERSPWIYGVPFSRRRDGLRHGLSPGQHRADAAVRGARRPRDWRAGHAGAARRHRLRTLDRRRAAD